MSDAILTRNKDGVISVWVMHNSPVWSMWENKKEPAFSCADDDESQRLKMLEEYLDLIKASGSTAQFTIKFHDEANRNGKVNNTTPVCGSLHFRLNELEPRPNAAVAPAGNASIDLLNQVFTAKMEVLAMKYDQQLAKKDEEIERLQLEAAAAAEEDGDDDFEEDDNLGMIGKIGELGERYPWMQGPINKLIEPLTGLLTMAKNKMQSEYPASAINGLHDTDTDQPAQAPPETARTDTRTDDERVKSAHRALINYFVNYHGFPPGSTDESIRATPEEQKEVYRLQGFKKYADTMVGLANLAKNKPDTMAFALNTLEGLK